MVTIIKWFFGIVGFLVALPFLVLVATMLYQVTTDASYRTMLSESFNGARTCVTLLKDPALRQECVSKAKQDSVSKYFNH